MNLEIAKIVPRASQICEKIALRLLVWRSCHQDISTCQQIASITHLTWAKIGNSDLKKKHTWIYLGFREAYVLQEHVFCLPNHPNLRIWTAPTFTSSHSGRIERHLWFGVNKWLSETGKPSWHPHVSLFFILSMSIVGSSFCVCQNSFPKPIQADILHWGIYIYFMIFNNMSAPSVVVTSFLKPHIFFHVFQTRSGVRKQPTRDGTFAYSDRRVLCYGRGAFGG